MPLNGAAYALNTEGHRRFTTNSSPAIIG